jgi:hypothetical protein
MTTTRTPLPTSPQSGIGVQSQTLASGVLINTSIGSDDPHDFNNQRAIIRLSLPQPNEPTIVISDGLELKNCREISEHTSTDSDGSDNFNNPKETAILALSSLQPNQHTAATPSDPERPDDSNDLGLDQNSER